MLICLIRRKNVILFEPNPSCTQTTDRLYVSDESFDPQPIRIFYSQKDKHFDVIFTLQYVESLAECQSIVYEVLYTQVFKLPDVRYATERMLHDQKGEVTVPLPDDETKYITANGEIFSFDLPENTCCVLKDPETCHFHNQTNFEEVVRKNQGSFTIINRSDDPGRLKIYKPTDGYLYDQTKSCVRQLLDENITPFPYKVAKALDTCIYRNTEFEYWHDLRKQLRLKWHDVENDKYLVQCPQLLQNLDEQAYLTLDDDGKKKYIYVSSKDDDLTAKKFGYLTGFDHFRPSRDMLEPIIMPMHHHNQQQGYRPWRGPRRTYNNQQRSHSNYAHDDRDFQYIEQEPIYNHTPQPIYQDGYQFIPYADPNSPPPFYQAQPMQPQMVQYIPQTNYAQPPMTYQPANAYNHQQQPIAFPNFSVPPPPIVTYPPPATTVNGNSAAAGTSKETNGDYMNLIRENELSSTHINWNPKESIDVNGNDLPTNDMASLQFFYNLGVRYLFAAGLQRKLENVVSHMDSLDIQQESETLKCNQPPPVPTNTPVTTKGPNNYGPPGNRSHYNNNNNGNQYNYRRGPFSNQNSRNDHGNQKDNNNNNNKGDRRGHYNNNNNHYNHNNNGFNRKEIQFNSNVKNVHKAETNMQKHNNAQPIQAAASNVTQDKSGSVLSVNSGQVSSPNNSPVSISNETTGTSSEHSNQNQLPALTIPPPQVQMAYAVSFLCKF